MGTGTCPEGITLSHESALEFHRKRRVTAALGKPYPELSEIPRTPSGGVAVKELARELGLPTPLQLTISDGCARISSPYARCLVPRYETCAERICTGLSVATPEDALFQICEGSAPLRQLLLAYELCGTFAICSDEEDGFVTDVEPLATPQSILANADTKDGNRDSPRFRILRRVAGSLAAGAASPAEAKLCLAIVAPRIMGGQGLPKPELNAELPVRGTGCTLTQRQVIRPDELWSGNKLILEYMGSHHAEAERMGEDASRDNTLNAMGYKVIHVTKHQVQDPALYSGLMELLRRELGVRKYMPSQQILKKQEALRAILFGTRHSDW